ncbi:hypothetical protein P154DRAFT_518449 [Amniculicola lignicola CBS 123094]|uniref:Uncharacterized protein n=1 Tax=Amniculicola lignicola CBS 123094 TaxID=1392246 RepID=A0A6A5WVE0_9PLEO|nr:hypothetical protein P154DRAFT_518449 [Amniculicola lignicola CBS 123094]
MRVPPLEPYYLVGLGVRPIICQRESSSEWDQGLPCLIALALERLCEVHTMVDRERDRAFLDHGKWPSKSKRECRNETQGSGEKQKQLIGTSECGDCQPDSADPSAIGPLAAHRSARLHNAKP